MQYNVCMSHGIYAICCDHNSIITWKMPNHAKIMQHNASYDFVNIELLYMLHSNSKTFKN